MIGGFSGFTEKHWKPHGINKALRLCMRDIDDDVATFNAIETDDPWDVAQQINWWYEFFGGFDLYFLMHSWGCICGNDTADYLGHFGIPVNCGFFADPVSKDVPWYLRSLWGRGKFIMSSNFKRAIVWRSQSGTIRGCKNLTLEDPNETEWIANDPYFDRPVSVPHREVDELDDFYTTILKEVKNEAA